MAQVKIQNETVLSDEKYTLKRIAYKQETQDGQLQQQERQVFDHGNAATILLYNCEKQTVILTRQFRIATYVNGNESGMLMETPAGLLEKNEAPETAILREVKEETGYELTHVKRILAAYSSAGILTELIHFFVAPYTDEQKKSNGGGLKEEGEDLQVLELPFTEALDMVNRGEIRDAKTILLLQYAKLHVLL